MNQANYSSENTLKSEISFIIKNEFHAILVLNRGRYEYLHFRTKDRYNKRMEMLKAEIFDLLINHQLDKLKAISTMILHYNETPSDYTIYVYEEGKTEDDRDIIMTIPFEYRLSDNNIIYLYKDDAKGESYDVKLDISEILKSLNDFRVNLIKFIGEAVGKLESSKEVHESENILLGGKSKSAGAIKWQKDTVLLAYLFNELKNKGYIEDKNVWMKLSAFFIDKNGNEILNTTFPNLVVGYGRSKTKSDGKSVPKGHTDITDLIKKLPSMHLKKTKK